MPFETEEAYLQAIDAGMVTEFDNTDPKIIDHLIDREIERNEASSFSAGSSFSSSAPDDGHDDLEAIQFGGFPGTGEVIGTEKGDLIFVADLEP